MENKKKILFIIDNLSTGGVNTSLSAVYARLKDDFNIRVFALTHDGYKNHSFSEVLLPKNLLVDAFQCEISRTSSFTEKLLKQCVKFLKRISIMLKLDMRKILFRSAAKAIESADSYDRIIAFQEGPSTHFSKYFGTNRKIAWVHSDYTRSFPKSNAEEYATYDKLVFVSKYTLIQFNQKYPFIQQPLVTIHNYIDYDRILELSNDEIKDGSFSCSQYNIISMGRIVELKQFRLIPAIARRLLDKGMLFKWFILGPICDQKEYETMMNNIKQYKCENTVIWLDNKSNPYPYLKASDLYVSLSTTEACPMVFNEARILNVPVCSNNFGSSYEFINHENNGLVGTIDEMPELIYSLYTNTDLRNRIINSALGSITSNDIITKCIKDILN